MLVEVDEDVSACDTARIAGSVRLGWATKLQHADVRDIVDRVAFGGLLSAKGIGNDDIVVLYAGNNNWFGAYAYWCLKLYGHKDVRLLTADARSGRRWPPADDRAAAAPAHRLPRRRAGPTTPRPTRGGSSTPTGQHRPVPVAAAAVAWCAALGHSWATEQREMSETADRRQQVIAPGHATCARPPRRPGSARQYCYDI